MNPLLTTRLLPLALALALAGCASPSRFVPTAPPATPAAFTEDGGARFVDVAPAAMPPDGDWWRAFHDPVLDDLVARAGAGSTDLQAAVARVTQARALLRSARAGLWPQVGLSAGAQRATIQPGLGARPGQAANLGNAALGASWEPDLFGKIGRARDAAQLDASASEAMLRSTRLAVQSEVAQAYFALRGLDAERSLVRQSVDADTQTRQLTERRYRDGDVAELDLARARAEVASTTAQALALDRQRALAEHALAVLLGELPSGFRLAEAGGSGEPPQVPAGVPGSVLARRPDVAAALLSMQAAEARVGVARRAWFPDVTLTADGGYASTDLGDLFKWSARAWGVGALLSLPVFDGGRRDAGVQQAEAQWDLAAAAYREQVLSAFRDVEDQLVSLRLLTEQADLRGQAVAAAARATALSDVRYRDGLVSQLELLDARRAELADRLAETQVRTARFEATVGLIRALGGGWGATDRPAPTASTAAAPQARRS